MRKCILALVSALAMAGCSGDKGDRGPPGPPGPPGGGGSDGGTQQAADRGLVLEIQSASVTDGQAPTVTFRARDATGAPIDVKAESVAGTFRPTFVLLQLQPNGKWNSYVTRQAQGQPYTRNGQTVQPALAEATQATGVGICSATPCNDADQARLVANGDGVFTYTFPNPVTGVSPNATHRAGIYGSRSFQDATQPGSDTLDFVPAGGNPSAPEVVTAAACNQCHTVVNAHGGSRRVVDLCVTCHSPQTVDPETGNDVDMANMIHKIHNGRGLEHGYVIVGFRQSVHDYSHVVMAPSHSTYFVNSDADAGLIRDCALCHQGAQAQQHQTAITAATCTQCHDGMNPGTQPLVQNGVAVPPGTGHGAGGFQVGAVGDQACGSCHAPGQTPFPVPTVHSVNYATDVNRLFQEHAYNVKIDAVNDAVAGGSVPPSVDFTLTLDGQPFNARANPAALGSLSFIIAGPITDYAETLPGSFSPQSALASGQLGPRVTDIDPAAGKFRYTFAPATPGSPVIPAGRTGVYVVAFESQHFENGGTPGSAVKPQAALPVFRGPSKNVQYVNVTSGAPSPAERRLIVMNEKCNACHVELGFHGNRARLGTDYCATCHNPNLSNAGRARFQPGDLITPQPGEAGFGGITSPVFVANSVAMSVFIHKIHAGATLSEPYRLGVARTATLHTPEQWAAANDGESAIADFSEFVSPTPVQNCESCHAPNTYTLPEGIPQLPVQRAILDCGATVTDSAGQEWCAGRTPNTTQGVLYTPSAKAACGSCHDSAAADAHMDLNTLRPMTVNAIETCTTCHGPGAQFDAARVHSPALSPTPNLQ